MLEQQDSAEFLRAVENEVNSNVEQKHWKLMERSKVPEGMDPLPSEWAIHRKRNPTTNTVTNFKAILNINGGKQECGVN